MFTESYGDSCKVLPFYPEQYYSSKVNHVSYVSNTITFTYALLISGRRRETLCILIDMRATHNKAKVVIGT
jgi:hypothetical protein